MGEQAFAAVDTPRDLLRVVRLRDAVRRAILAAVGEPDLGREELAMVRPVDGPEEGPEEGQIGAAGWPPGDKPSTN